MWSYTAQTPTDFYAQNISSAQRLPNGDTLVCNGPAGYFFEVTADGRTIWDYQTTTGPVFRVTRYAPDYAGFDGTSLESSDRTAVDGGYTIVDTGQTTCYDNQAQISPPSAGEAFYGQDAQYAGHQPSYRTSTDGQTAYDNNTGLTWQQTPDRNGDGQIDANDKIAWADIPAYVASLNAANYGGYNDWRLPTIKELYSLIDFAGTDPSGYNGTDTSGLTPFIDTSHFAFGFGDVSAGERIIDAQYWSDTQYVSTTMHGNATVFGVNFADGRIKGYPRDTRLNGTPTEYIRCVRGNTSYGENNFVDNGDHTVTDTATYLMWSQTDSNQGFNWQDALAWVQTQNAANYLGHSDWRLPNAKELQSIVDYTRSPDTTASAAIDPIFNCTQITNEAGQADYPWYWTSTTHASSNGMAARAVYVCFGRSMGYMNGSWLDVHGAGAQRSDPKGGSLSRLHVHAIRLL